MLTEYERLLVGEMLSEVTWLNSIHLELFYDATKQNKEKYEDYKEKAKKSNQRIADLGKRLMNEKSES